MPFSDCSVHLALTVLFVLSIYGCITNYCKTEWLITTAALEVRWFQLPVFLGVPLAMGPEFLEAPLGYRMSGLSLSPGGSQGLSSLYGLSSRGAELLKGWLRSPEYKSGSCQAFQRLRPGTISVPLLPPSFS